MSEPDEIDRSRSGLAVAALVLGILGFVLLPIVIGGIFGLAAGLLALLHLRSRPQGRGLAIAGLVFGAVAVAGSLAAGLLYFYMYREYREQARVMRADQDEEPDADGPGRDHSSWVGRAAPALTLTTVDGEAVQLDQLRGRPVVLDFWATWCAACKQELPALNRVARENPDIVILGISDEPASTLKAFADKHPFDFRIASLASAPAPFDGVRAIPTNVFIDRQGIIRDVHVGALSHAQILAKATAGDDEPAAATATK
jgi:peroxiredoxin